MKFVYLDEDGEPVISDLSPEQVDMLKGFYDLPEDDKPL